MNKLLFLILPFKNDFAIILFRASTSFPVNLILFRSLIFEKYVLYSFISYIKVEVQLNRVIDKYL